MFKIVISTLSILLTTTPAFSFDMEEYAKARSMFVGGVSQETVADYFIRYPQTIMQDLGGQWLSIPSVASDQVGGIVQKVCNDGRLTISFSEIGTTGFTETRSAGPIVTRYTVWMGNAFVKATPAEQVYARLTLDKQPASDNLDLLKYRSNQSWQGIVTIFRPSPDVLVFQTNHDVPTIYVRCP